MERCYQCANWFHTSCIRKLEDHIPENVWSCTLCRQMPSLVRQLVSTISEMHGMMTKLTDTVDDMKKTQDSLKKENEELREKLRDSISQVSAASTTNSHGDALLTSSLFRDVDERKLVATKKISISGGRIKDMQDALDKLDSYFKRLFFVCGGNDCDDKYNSEGTDASVILASFRDLINNAKLKADSVIVASICPRIRNDDVMDRINAVNAGLKTLCEELNVTFIDNDDIFYLRDGSLNDGYLLSDNVHLTATATNRLVKQLGLTLRQGCDNAYCDHRRRDSKTKQKSIQTNHVNTSDDDLRSPFFANAWKKVERRNWNKRSTPVNPPSRVPVTQHPRPSQSRPFTNDAANRPRSPPPSYAAQASRGASAGAPTMHRANGAHTAQHRNAPASYPARRPHSNPPHELTPPCQLCLGAGHSAVTCRARDATCFKCGQVGHLNRACTVTR